MLRWSYEPALTDKYIGYIVFKTSSKSREQFQKYNCSWRSPKQLSRSKEQFVTYCAADSFLLATRQNSLHVCVSVLWEICTYKRWYVTSVVPMSCVINRCGCAMLLLEPLYLIMSVMIFHQVSVSVLSLCCWLFSMKRYPDAAEETKGTANSDYMFIWNLWNLYVSVCVLMSSIQTPVVTFTQSPIFSEALPCRLTAISWLRCNIAQGWVKQQIASFSCH